MLILFSDVVFAFSMNVKYILSEKDIFVLLLTLKIIIMVSFFISDNLTGSDEITNQVYLGRPWRGYGQAAFISCKASSHIKPEGYHYWQESRKNTCKLSIYKTLNEKELASFTKVLNEKRSR